MDEVNPPDEEALVPARPMRNRVTPSGEIVAIPLRGRWLGNRGMLHRGSEIVRSHANNLWIVCELEFKGRSIAQWAPHHYTVLFFHDEAVALAAGHRPCAYCRRAAYHAYQTAWSLALGVEPPGAATIDRQLHSERIIRGTHERQVHSVPWAEVPTGAFVIADQGPALAFENCLVPWTLAGYGPASDRPTAGAAAVLTPPSTLGALRAGYAPQIDASARTSATRFD
jgi:hypothetical protein